MTVRAIQASDKWGDYHLLAAVALAGLAAAAVLKGLAALGGLVAEESALSVLSGLQTPDLLAAGSRFRGLLWCVAAVMMYTLVQEMLLRRTRSPLTKTHLVVVLVVLSCLCALLTLFPLGVEIATARAETLGTVGAIARAVAALTISVMIFGPLAAPSSVVAYLVRQHMDRAESRKALRQYLAGLVGLLSIFCTLVILLCLAGVGELFRGNPAEFRRIALLNCLYGTVGLFAGGLARLLIQRDRGSPADDAPAGR